MGTTSNILTLLKFYVSKQHSPAIDYDEFVDYLRRYSQHHMDEKPELVIYTDATAETLLPELDRLAGERQIALVSAAGNKRTIFVVDFLVDRFTERYEELRKNFSIPFPCVQDLPRGVPQSVAEPHSCSDIIYNRMEQEDLTERTLYAVQFTKGIPSLLLPSTVSVSTVISAALKKLQDLMRKEESHDYFFKKLTVSNPGKELSTKNFFTKFVARPEEALDGLKTGDDTFYYWNQLCYFIRQDYTKLKDLTPEDVNVLQSVALIEVATSFHKSKATARQQRDAALRQLDDAIHMPPYYFDMDTILRLKDENGSPLMEKYTEEELKSHLSSLTSETFGETLPRLLIFRAGSENNMTSYFIFKDKVMPLVVRLCNDARAVIKESLEKSWYKSLAAFETLPEMKENAAFERCLERELKVCDPVLYGLLAASFLPVVAFEDSTPGTITLYRDGVMVTYSELLLLSRNEIYSDAKVKLPFWYSLPFIPAIMAWITRKPKKKQPKKNEPKAATAALREEQQAKAEEKERTLASNDHSESRNYKKEIRKAAGVAESKIVPESSSLDRELDGYLHEWNDRLGKEHFDNLTEDVNTLIRDYMRKVLRTVKAESYTPERISSLAQSLVDAPALINIKNHPALKRYIELYMIKLLKNLP